MDMQEAFKHAVVWYFNEKFGKPYKVKISIEDVYVVWFSKTIQNWKALLSTTIPDGMYYELTLNGDKGELYIDSYRQMDHKVLKDFNSQV